jgi:hypothetical protein
MPNIQEALQLLQNLHDYADSKFDYDSEEACVIHNSCVSIAEALGIDDITF